MKKWLGDSPSRIIQNSNSQRKKKMRGKKRIVRRCEKLMQAMLNEDFSYGMTNMEHNFRSGRVKLKDSFRDGSLLDELRDYSR